MSDFEVRGADDFLKLSKSLKAAGRTGLRKELNKGLRDGAKPLIPKARQSAKQNLPQRGGLADIVAREPMRVQVRTGDRTAGVRIVVGRKGGGARATNRGVVRHPVFHSGTFVEQSIPQAKDWFDRPMREGAPQVRPELERAIDRIADQVVRDAK